MPNIVVSLLARRSESLVHAGSTTAKSGGRRGWKILSYLSDILFVLNTQLADATKMREVGSEVRTIVTGDSEKARLYVLNITENNGTKK